MEKPTTVEVSARGDIKITNAHSFESSEVVREALMYMRANNRIKSKTELVNLVAPLACITVLISSFLIAFAIVVKQPPAPNTYQGGHYVQPR